MICINKDIKFGLPEKRIAFVASVCNKQMAFRMPPVSQEAPSLPQLDQKHTSTPPEKDLGVSNTIFSCGEREREKGNHYFYDEGFCL